LIRSITQDYDCRGDLNAWVGTPQLTVGELPEVHFADQSLFCRDDYRGNILHHVVSNNSVSLKNLPFIISVLCACGVLFEKYVDTNGQTPYACLATKRYFGFQIFSDILRLTKQLSSTAFGLDDRSAVYLLENRIAYATMNEK
jgi:hypothetical protein